MLMAKIITLILISLSNVSMTNDCLDCNKSYTIVFQEASMFAMLKNSQWF